MDNVFGQHIIIDFYNCYKESLSEPKDLSDIIASALEMVDHPIEEMICSEYDEEIVLSTTSEGTHMNVHSYPNLGYVAVDIYAFKQEWKVTALTRLLKEFFGAERIKATTLQRADFGSMVDMKPRYKTTLTTKGRVKQTGKHLKKTGLKVLRVIKKSKNKV